MATVDRPDSSLDQGPLAGEVVFVRTAFAPTVGARLVALAGRQHVSLQSVVRRAVREFLSREDGERPGPHER